MQVSLPSLLIIYKEGHASEWPYEIRKYKLNHFKKENEKS